MTQRHWFIRRLQLGCLGCLGWIGTLAPLRLTLAQSNIVPDNTLGTESSVVLPNAQGLPREEITGGAVSGANLFHSFQEFNVSAGRGAYFLSPDAAIQNILARVTGSNRSEILGTLGTIGNSAPNLFLINPNGIIFGENASLNVGGSFVGSTANAIQFGNQGIFSASTPNAPGQLLTINPSALLFNQLSTAAITNRSAPAGMNPANVVTGLRVQDGRSLLLVGGNVNIDGGSLRAYEGRIELAGLASRGTLGLNVAGNTLSLSVPESVERADVSLTNGAEVNVRANGGGSIAINARNFLLAGASNLRSGIESLLSASVGNAGDIEINATGETTLTDGSFIASVVQSQAVGNAGNINITTGSLTVRNATLSTSTFGSGDSGSVFVQASGMVSVANSNIFSNVNAGAVGNSGGILIKAGSLGTDGAQLQSSILGADASVAGGRGNAGNVNIRVSDRVTLAGVDQNGFPSAILTNIETGAVGNAGDININAGSLSLTDGARLTASTSGQGNAGSVLVQARDAVSVAGRDTAIFSGVNAGAVGNGGIINIQAGEFSLTDGAQLVTLVRGASETLPGGRGNAGNVNIRVSNTVTLAGVDQNGLPSTIFTDVGSGAVGNGGDINILTGALFLTNAALSASTSGQGDAGSISVQATDSVSLANSFFFSDTASPSAVGNSGNIDINARALSLTNAALFTGNSGQGNAGSISVQARESVSLINSNIISSVGAVTSVGNGGNININARTLSLNNSSMQAFTNGKGDAGSITVRATDSVSLTNRSILGSPVSDTAVGKAGDITIEAGTLSLTNGSLLIAVTDGKGDAGSITVRATDSVSLTNESAFGSVVLDGGVGKGGDITIEAGTLSLTNGARIDAKTNGQGDAGNIQVNATDSVSVFGTSSITGRSSALFTFTEPSSTGFGGDITVNTNVLSVSDGAVLDARTTNNRNGGDITVNARRVSAINGGQLLTTTESSGSAGKITVNATDSFIVNGSDATFNDRVAQFGTAVANPEAASGLFVRSDGLGSAGDIEVTSPKILLDNFGRFIAESASGNGGNITLLGDLLLLRRSSQISTNAGTELFGGDGGNININSKFIVAIPQENSDITANAYTGTGGRVEINSQGILGIQSRPRLTDLSDITASSTLGIAGVIDINTDVSDALQNNLNQLPENIIDANALIANSCIARRNNSPGGTFLITGNGGLAERPGEATLSPYSTGTIRSIPNEGDLATSPTSNTTHRPWKNGNPIVEAQGIYRLANGDLVLSRECP